ncbi:MAG: nucleotidyltransferase domain-containing protein [Proteobacteria bacterium]|nr:nucleotidyltransferase domain-containing protein [Pseudomonadota bacterium]
MKAQFPKAKDIAEHIRLSEFTILTLQKAFKETFGENDHLWLFGSRTNLEKKGGDIDLYIETYFKNIEDILTARARFYAKLMMILGEQKIDIVIKYDQTDLPIYRYAKQQGVQLV